MDFLSNLALGFSVALTPFSLRMAVCGVLLGILIGALPGVGPYRLSSPMIGRSGVGRKRVDAADDKERADLPSDTKVNSVRVCYKWLACLYRNIKDEDYHYTFFALEGVGHTRTST